MWVQLVHQVWKLQEYHLIDQVSRLDFQKSQYGACSQPYGPSSVLHIASDSFAYLFCSITQGTRRLAALGYWADPEKIVLSAALEALRVTRRHQPWGASLQSS